MAEVGRLFEEGEYFVPEMLIVARAIKGHDAGVMGISALLTTTMPAMRTTIEALKEAGLKEQVSVMIGGAPVTQNYADEIGADIYAPDGSSAARKAKEAIGA